MNMTLTDRQLKHVQKPYIATLATLRKDGSPHMAPVWYRYENGAFFVLTDEGSQKHKNVMRDPRVELCIDDPRASAVPHRDRAWTCHSTAASGR